MTAREPQEIVAPFDPRRRTKKHPQAPFHTVESLWNEEAEGGECTRGEIVGFLEGKGVPATETRRAIREHEIATRAVGPRLKLVDVSSAKRWFAARGGVTVH